MFNFLIPYLLGLFSSIIFFLFERLYYHFGNLRIYFKTISGREDACSLGCITADNGKTYFELPFLLEIQNTCHIEHFVRNIGISIYRDGVKIKEMYQIKAKKSSTASNYPELQFVSSCVVPQRGFISLFCVYDCDTNDMFIPGNYEFKIHYNGNSDKFHSYLLFSTNSPLGRVDEYVNMDWKLLN